MIFRDVCLDPSSSPTQSYNHAAVSGRQGGECTTKQEITFTCIWPPLSYGTTTTKKWVVGWSSRMQTCQPLWHKPRKPLLHNQGMACHMTRSRHMTKMQNLQHNLRVQNQPSVLNTWPRQNCAGVKWTCNDKDEPKAEILAHLHARKPRHEPNPGQLNGLGG